MPQFLVAGSVRPGFEPVREAFIANFEKQGEVGAAVCLYVGGKKVVDLWGGMANRSTGQPWKEDTLVPVRSLTKGATAVCAHLLVQRGLLDLEAPVAEYWPEFAAEGKGSLPVKWLLSHQAGLPALNERPPFEASLTWEPIVEALAAQRPLWQPGTAHGYHALTFGWLVGEVIRRITGLTPGKFFAQEVAKPLGLDFWVGLPQSQEARVANLIPPGMPKGLRPILVALSHPRELMAYRDPNGLLQRSTGLTDPPVDRFDTDPRVHAAEMPAHNGITDARSVARLYAALIGEVDGIRLLTAETIQRATTTQADGKDKVLLHPTKFGLGFALDSPFAAYGSPTNFGHPGAGGSLGFADPEAGFAFGYVMNNMLGGMLQRDPRTAGLIHAVRSCISL
jgi:CubicO group peptidase (beta-lactamase class C family)